MIVAPSAPPMGWLAYMAVAAEAVGSGGREEEKGWSREIKVGKKQMETQLRRETI